MADKQPTKSKRRVKNPETFRERALKANEAAGRSKAKVGVGRSVGTGFGYVTRPFVRILKPVLTSLPFRLVGKVLGKVLFLGSFRRSWQELRQVNWPNWRQSRRLTMAVLIFAIVFGAAIAGVDFVMEKAFKDILLK
jgi:preprotein translocase SecE subunit